MNSVLKPVLEIRDLDIALPEGADRKLAVGNLSLDLYPNETLCVVGESGSGKSLLVTAIMGLLPYGTSIARGSIRFDGRSLERITESEYRRIRGSRIAMVFQEPMSALNPVLTVFEQMDEVLRAHGVNDGATRRQRIVELLTAMGLPDPEVLQHAYPFRLSGGQRQRVMIAMALALEPDILIADEPTTALDVTTQKQILELLARIQKEKRLAVLFITHDFGVVADIADRVAVMQHGELVESGPVETVLNQPRHAYTRQLIDAVHGLSREALPPSDNADRPILEVIGVEKTYITHVGMIARRKREVRALDHINLTLKRGETIGLVGESGSGKSTLGQVIVRLLKEDAGVIRFDGEDFSAMSPKRFAQIRPRIQMIFQDPTASLNPRHKIRRILTETQIIHGATPGEALARAREMLDLVRLDHSALDRYPHEFSGGQKQRIGIARALVLQPSLVIADEAVSALDVSIQAQVLELLLEIRKRLKLSMLFITHDLRIAAQVCDRIAVMRRGAIVEFGDSAAVMGNPQHDYTTMLLDSMPGKDWFLKEGRLP